MIYFKLCMRNIAKQRNVNISIWLKGEKNPYSWWLNKPTFSSSGETFENQENQEKTQTSKATIVALPERREYFSKFGKEKGNK